jgi:predicted nucleic acid-binding protein
MPNERIDCFLDTNILIYAAQVRTRDERRTAIARDLVLSRLFGVSAQTLAEFYVVTTRKAHVRLPPDETDRWLAFLASLPLQTVDHDVVVRGIRLSRQYGIRYYDAALLAAAERLGAPVFFSEDLNHNQTYGDVRVVNPFLEA